MKKKLIFWVVIIIVCFVIDYFLSGCVMLDKKSNDDFDRQHKGWQEPYVPEPRP